MRILGVDPGLLRTGYACVEIAARGTARPALIEAGLIRLPPKRSVGDRLVELERDLDETIARLRPESAALESLFARYERPAAVIAMGHARGVILLCLRRAGLSVSEIAPARAKKSLTGFGAASKRQVQLAVKARLGLSAPLSPADVSDAAAIALCAASGAGYTGRR